MRPFALPDPAVARHPNVILAPRELGQWIEQLPMGNPPRTAQQLYQQLRLLVRDPSPGPRLTALLDGYLPTLERLQQIVETRLPADADSALPLDQLELLILEILSELASGYLRACNQLLVHGKAPPLAVLSRAAGLLDDAAILASLHYHQPPQPNWPLLLDVYLLAHQLQLDRQPGAGKRGVPDLSDTVHARFFAALFTAICDPHHHRPGQIRAWHEWLLHNSADLALTTLPQGNASIPVDISGALTPLAAARTAKPGEHTRYVVTDPLREALATDPEAPSGLHETLDDLLRGRRSPDQRQAPRQTRNHPYQLLFGLYPIAQRLLSLSGDTDRPPPTRHDARQVNQSKTGAAFVLPGTLQTPLAVGEPILAEAEAVAGNGATVGFLARIQRVMIDPGRQIEIGVEKLPGRIMPVTISGSASERLRGDTAALLLHRPDIGGFVLIASRRVYREGEIVGVEGPSVRHSLRMRGQPTATPRLSYIDVEVEVAQT
jgi:hypothetical protein